MEKKLQRGDLFKRVLSLALAIVMVLGFVPTTASAETTADYYLVGFINGSDYSGDDYKFVDGKLNVTIVSDSYVCVKNGETGNWFMTDGWLGTEVTEATLYEKSGDKLFVPAGDYTFTLVENEDGTLTLSYAEPVEELPDDSETTADYYLVGFINGSDYSGDDYKFVNGKLTATITSDSYVCVKNGETGNWFMTDGWLGTEVTEATLYEKSGDKLFVPAGSYTFTLVENEDGTLTLSYTTVKDDSVTESTYIIAGTAGLCGTEWTPEDTSNKMSLNEDGLYEKYFIDVPAGTHKFKVTNGTWSSSWGGGDNADSDGNYVFTTTKVQNVRITFNADSKEIGVELIDIEPYYVAGTEALCGVGWDPGYEGNKMSLGEDGLYFKTFKSVPAGTHELKITTGSWNNECWGNSDGSNYSFTTEEEHNVTITFDPETKAIGVILSEATEPDPVEPAEYDITIKVHYYRADGDYTDWEVHMWNGVASLSATRAFEDEEAVYNGVTYPKTATYYADASDTWVGFIIKQPDWTKDPDGDRKVDISNVLSGTVHVYAKSGSALEDFVTDKSEATLGAKVTAAVYDSLEGTLTVTTSMAIEAEDLMSVFTLTDSEGNDMTITKVTNIAGTNDYLVEYEGEITTEEKFYIYYNGAACEITVPNTYSTETFESEYTYTGNDLGATWTKEGTTFRVWAPTATAVSVNLYESGTEGTDDLIDSVEMTADVNGTWVVTVEGDLNGTYYTYSVTRSGETVEACDPYARTTGVNGNRAMVIDLDSTDPEGWENDDYVTQDNYTDAVIWELHVRDFSIDASSGISEANKGKYLAFTETGTTVNGEGEISTGIDYMKELGVNYVHLLPVYDINSVDETVGGYNWGYDPKNYNVPEGSYSTDPYNGEVRVNEFKQMVQSLHEAGIGVVMDVVYNHVADAENFCFNKIVPGYFSRIQDDGSYQSNSGCGNDTASERSMVSKYIVDSVLYWNTEYHIDGFRWDLVGLIDYETINAVMAAVHEVNPDIIFYGEGWEMCSWTTKDGYVDKMTIQANDEKVNTEAGTFAFFNDTIRNAIHGGVFTATDKGYASGVGVSDTLIDCYLARNSWGSYGTVDTPLQTINYASCHDNYTLFDNLMIDTLDGTSNTAEAVYATVAAKNNLAAAYYITAQGVPFIHAGEEMLRSKPDSSSDTGYNHNSYASGDAINSIKWSSLENETVASTHDYYQGLIAFRKAHSALRLTTAEAVDSAVEVIANSGNTMAFHISANGEELVTAFNSGSTASTITLPKGEWDIYVQGSKAGTEVLGTAEGTVTVDAISSVMLVKHVEEAHEHDYEAVVTAPTCTEKGYTTYTCACGDSYVDDYVDATGHSHEAVVTEPTCTEKGYTTYTCACGDSYVDDYVDATGHSYELTAEVEPTCTEKGSKTYTCHCGDTYTEEVDALGHNYEGGKCTECGEDDPNSVPAETVKPVWKSWLDKIFGKWFGDEEETPTEPSEPAPEEPSEPEESVPAEPVKPSKPGWGGIIDWFRGLWG